MSIILYLSYYNLTFLLKIWKFQGFIAEIPFPEVCLTIIYVPYIQENTVYIVKPSYILISNKTVEHWYMVKFAQASYLDSGYTPMVSK